MTLKDKTVLVTGGGSGIGLAVARCLAERGARVAIVGRSADKLRLAASTVPDRPLHPFPCDVADRAAVERVVESVTRQLGGIAILVHAAGINVVRRAMAELAPEDWDRVLAVNATGAYNCIRAVLPGMRARRDGLIVNISSIAGKRALELAGTAYCASKFALTALSYAVGLEERKNGIRVTNICPGEVNTPILEQRPTPVPEERRAAMLQGEDIAQVVATIAELPPRAHVWEVIMTPLYQEYA
ncbi:SDR family oxidoreductase [Thermopirellula anaerolimosa]